MAEGDIDKAEELSDRLATREVSELLTKALRKHFSFVHLYKKMS